MLKWTARFILMSVALAINGASVAALQPAPSAVPAASVTPVADHHLHLAGPSVVLAYNGPELPIITLPFELASVLTRRQERWNDRIALQELYTEDALVAGVRGPTAGLFRGRVVAAGFVSRRFTRPYSMRPVAYRQSGTLATITGYYTRANGASTLNNGFFQLSLKKGADGAWLIESESVNAITQLPQAPITAAQVVTLLDAAHIHWGVVLSQAFGIGSKNMDPYRDQYTPAEKYRLVRAENDWTAEQVALFPDRLVAFCSFDPLDDFALTELDRCASSRRFTGIKLHLDESGVDLANAAHVEKLRQVFASANRHRLPIIIHIGNNQGTDAENRANVATFLNKIVTAAPDVTVQVAHLWGGQKFSEAALDAYVQAVEAGAPGTKNLYFDIAEAPMMAHLDGDRAKQILDRIAKGIREIGVKRILFGSDGPDVGHLDSRTAWEQFRSEVPLSQVEMRTIAENIAPYLRR